MKFKVETLVDITPTNARRGNGDNFAYNQNQNFLTVIQTIGLRVNLNIVSEPTREKRSAKEFGTKYKGQHNIWEFLFEVEYAEALTLDMLQSDFDLVPVILDLSETAKMKNSIFRTTDSSEKNIIFKLEY